MLSGLYSDWYFAGTTDESNEAVLLNQQDDGCSMKNIQGTSSSCLHSAVSVGKFEDSIERPKGDIYPPCKASKQPGKKSGLTVRFKSKWRD